MEWEDNCSLDDSTEATDVGNIGIWTTHCNVRGRETEKQDYKLLSKHSGNIMKRQLQYSIITY